MIQPKIGVVGFGYWGKNQARVFDELGALSGIYEENINETKEFQQKYHFFSTLDELILNVDAVIICTPAKFHYEIALKSLNAGKDILVEKPIAMNTDEVKNLIKIENKNNNLIMVGHQLHFHPAIVELKKFLESNEIGKVQWIYSNRLNMGKIRPYENVLWSFAPHDISLILDIMGVEIKKIEIQASKILNNQIEDTSMTLIDFNNGKKAHIFVSWIHPFKEQRFVVVGEKGSLVFSDTEKDEKLKLFHTQISKDGRIENHICKNITLPNHEPLKKQAEYFLEAIDNRKILINTSTHALNVVKVLEISTSILNEQNI
jgi:UDP-2-acetamido-3-amino-2,3-dideoxy-glucuronate N-acetyltransferase